ncbi:MAG: hypothetical protein M3066_02975 [Actinomycetota bacterium]|nr:hypothetical protein [Actinomycetota bacterium]
MKVQVVVAMMVLGLGLAACGGGGEAADIASTGDPSSTAATTEPTTALLSPSTSTSAMGPSTSAAPTTTTRRPTTTRAPATTVPTSTTIGAPPTSPRCEDVPFAVEVTTERATYRPGEIIRGTYTMRNTSGAACVYRNVSFMQSFEDASGRAVGVSGAGHTDGFGDSAVAAGATIEVFDLVWDQKNCSGTGACVQAPPGAYTASVTFIMSGTQRQGSRTFQLVAA